MSLVQNQTAELLVLKPVTNEFVDDYNAGAFYYNFHPLIKDTKSDSECNSLFRTNVPFTEINKVI